MTVLSLISPLNAVSPSLISIENGQELRDNLAERKRDALIFHPLLRLPASVSKHLYPVPQSSVTWEADRGTTFALPSSPSQDYLHLSLLPWLHLFSFFPLPSLLWLSPFPFLLFPSIHVSPPHHTSFPSFSPLSTELLTCNHFRKRILGLPGLIHTCQPQHWTRSSKWNVVAGANSVIST